VLVRQRAFGADDALGDRRFGHQEGAGDLLGRQAAEQPERERSARLRQRDAHSMASFFDFTWIIQ
jgi:hypothetical protein